MANSGQLQVLFVYLLVLCKKACSSAQSSAIFKLTASGNYVQNDVCKKSLYYISFYQQPIHLIRINLYNVGVVQGVAKHLSSITDRAQRKRRSLGDRRGRVDVGGTEHYHMFFAQVNTQYKQSHYFFPVRLFKLLIFVYCCKLLGPALEP